MYISLVAKLILCPEQEINLQTSILVCYFDNIRLWRIFYFTINFQIHMKKNLTIFAVFVYLTPLLFSIQPVYADDQNLPDQPVLATEQTPPEQIFLTIRSNGLTAFSGSVNLPDQNATDISVTATNGSSGILVPARSVLGILEVLQASSTNFQITNLSYSESYNSFLINCIAVPADSPTPDCYNWTDAINKAYPQVGIDHQILKDGDTIYLFFGQPHQTDLSTSSVTTGERFIATAKQYDLVSGTYKPLPGVTLGVGTQNSDYSFTELATSTVDANAQATFTLSTTGTFSVGIQEDYYFPSVSITVTEAQTPPTQAGGDGAGVGGGTGINHLTFNTNSALDFLSNSQNTDGSFDSALSTDWAAIALAATDPFGEETVRLRDNLLNTRPKLSDVTDFERHAMALEALGINPYSGTSINCIDAITNAFDGTQIGTVADNDDIFALIVLKSAGFKSNDAIIQKETAYILSTQAADGSWDGTTDMTAAAIQALIPISDVPGVNTALRQAAEYFLLNQSPDGGFGNIDSTSWGQTAVNWFIEQGTQQFNSESAWTSSLGLFPTDALATGQQQDGGVKSQNRVWSTSYALTAASGKSWPKILSQFQKPAALTSGNTAAVLGASTSTTADVLTPRATTTPDVLATTSPAIIPTPSLPISAPATTPTPVNDKKPTSKKTAAKIQTIPVLPDKIDKKITSANNIAAAAVVTNLYSNRPGLFGRIWSRITSFFRRLF